MNRLAAAFCASIAFAGAAVAAPGVSKMQQHIVVIDVPSNLGLRPPKPGHEPGVRHLASALRKTGLIDRLRAKDAGRVEAPAHSNDPDPVTGFRNGPAMHAYAKTVAERIGPLLARGDFVLTLGGDCGILVGPALALKTRGRYGLAYIDAHDDFSYARDKARYHGRFAAGGLALGLATGHGPEALVDIDGKAPYMRHEDAIHIGLHRTSDEVAFAATETFDNSGIKALTRADVARQGARRIGAQAKAELESDATEGFWIHVDADVLDKTIMPAVDSPNDNGLSFEELRDILTELLSSPKAVGLEITIFDPELDPDGALARRLAATIEQAFVNSGRFAAP